MTKSPEKVGSHTPLKPEPNIPPSDSDAEDALLAPIWRKRTARRGTPAATKATGQKPKRKQQQSANARRGLQIHSRTLWQRVSAPQ